MSIAVGGAACGPGSRESPTAEGADGGPGGGGGATCESGAATVCQGDAVHTCNADGTVGDMLETCTGGCWEGACGGGGGGDEESCGTAGNDLIYVVDRNYRLLSFDPRALDSGGDPFALIGELDCPAGAPWPDWGGGQATPFSMSVDREGMAWVLYTSGEIFRVSIQDASCTDSGFQRGQEGFELFGMGYVSDAQGSDQETLYIAGGPAEQEDIGDLGRVAGGTMAVAMVGGLPDSEYPPELTGTGNGELYAYFPGLFDSWVARLAKTSADMEESWDMQPINGEPRGWAFAHWGGKFYVFISAQQPFGGIKSQVRVLDPATGGEDVAISNSQYVVVGAGVSTCAPVVVE